MGIHSLHKQTIDELRQSIVYWFRLPGFYLHQSRYEKLLSIAMHYTSLQLKNFRSYTDFSVELGAGVNIIVGPNASGKTNLLEAIYVVSKGSSFRATDRSLITIGSPWLRIQALTDENHERIMTVTLENDDTTTKKYKIDGVNVKRLTTNKIVPVVLFEPDHLRMISGGPERRREYLDGILSQLSAEYKQTLSRYKKALAQRNKILKMSRPMMRDDLFVWDVQLSEYGAKIHAARYDLVARVNSLASSLYSSISGRDNLIEVRYDEHGIQDNYASRMLKELQARFEHDMRVGYTTRGVHREDMDFYIDGKRALQSASRGETRSLVLVCKLVETAIVGEQFSKPPIVLLDDVFSELDGARRRALTEHLRDMQTIITTTDADAIVKSFLDGYTVIATS